MGFLNEICFLVVLALWIYVAILLILAMRRIEKRIYQAIDDLTEIEKRIYQVIDDLTEIEKRIYQAIDDLTEDVR